MRRLLLTTISLMLLTAACSSGGSDVDTAAPSSSPSTSSPTTSAPPATHAPTTEHADDHGDEHPTDDAFADDMSVGGETHHEACDAPVTDEQRAAADELIAAVMAEAPRLATEQQAFDAGYVTIAPPFAGHGAHLVNPELFDDGAIVDPTKPESLVYLDGKLEGVMFIMDEVGQEGPQPGGCLTQWHGHDDLCMTAPIQEAGMVVFLTDFGPCPGGSELIIPPPMLHVWIVDNPEGAFAGLET